MTSADTEDATVRRLAPGGHRGGPCPERATLPQGTPEGLRPCTACCVECGRITARRYTDPQDRRLPWCGGLLPATNP